MDTPGKAATSTEDLNTVSNSPAGPARFKCDYCNKMFKSKSRLFAHKQDEIEQIQTQNLKISVQKQQKLEQVQAKNSRIRKCAICGTIFDTVEKLTKHNIVANCKAKRLSDVTTLDLQANQEFNIGKVTQSPESNRTPKLVAQLQDKLSDSYSPSTSQARVRKP